MMELLARRVEDLVRARQRQRIEQIAAELKAIIGSASIEVEDARVLVTGRGLTKRWLIDPRLRFFRGGLQ